MAVGRASVCLLALLATCAQVHGRNSFLTLCCGPDGESCCGDGWQLHCCSPNQNRCCLGGEHITVRGHRKHKHDWDDWEWDHDDWLPVTLVVILCVVAISCLLLCCCRRRREQRSLRHEFRLLPHYKYGAIPPRIVPTTETKHQEPSNAQNLKMYSPPNAPPPPYSETTWS
ncbi:uncharacterized protein [Anabrus simplex]|uniref:uncharacterized protein n=1 Tax=Anabrus simplex TaxID=316456 RepID=UPI0035A28870